MKANKKQNLSWTLFLYALTLVLPAKADDTYNFYFQKAPGPVTVNQGSSRGAGYSPLEPQAIVRSEQQINSEKLEQALPTQRPDRIRLATGFFDWLGTSDQFLKNGYYREGPDELTHGQAMVSLGIPIGDLITLEGAGYYLTKMPKFVFRGQNFTASGRRYDWSAGLSLTALRSESTGFSLAGIAGGISVPYLHFAPQYSWSSSGGTSMSANAELKRTIRLYYGGRISFQLAKNVAMQVEIQRVNGFDLTRGGAGISIAL